MTADALRRLTAVLSSRYTIERQLGRGGMATVYLAEDVKHERHVAVKVLLPELAATLGGERFLQEIRVTANLQHPHILALYDSGEADGLLYYVMPYVEGESLRDRLKRETQLPVDDALRIAQQVASALDFAHRHDVIHRDIKPENILLHEGEAMVADFGIALAVKAAGGERLTETGLSIGTPEYMSPEQVAGERNIDARSDIYSMACVLYEMLAGDPPFVASSPRAVLAKHMTDPAPPITTVRSSVSPPVAAAISKALGKAPADRFESAKAFSEALFATEVKTDDDKKSIVVLPFDNLSPDPDQEYFSDGLTEEVISDLSRVHALDVISRSSAMTFKGSNKKIPEIARELNVRYVLEGSVRRAGSSLRITAQLIDAERDVHLWAAKYTGTLDDVFDVQEKVSLAIVDALKINLTPEEEQRICEQPTDDVAAYEVYLRAHQDVFRELSADGLGRAKRNIQDALDVIGPNAHLYAAMAWVHFQYVNWGLVQDEGIALMDECLNKALALDPDCPSAHTVHGFRDFIIHYDPQAAARTFKRALAVNPNESLALGGLACVYFVSRISRSVVAVVDRLARVDPLNWLTRWAKGAVHFYAGDYDMALEPWRRVYEVAPGSEGAQFYYASALMYTGDSTGAIGVLERATAAEAASGYVKMLKYTLDGDTDALGGELTPELRKTTERDPYWSHHVAAMYGMLGEYEEAMRWIEQAVNVGFINYPMLAEHDPFLTELRGRPEYEALLERVKSEWEEFEI